MRKISTTRAAGPRIRTPDQRLRVFISSTLGELAPERRVGARMVALEALTRLARLHETGVKRDDARRRLRSVVDSFTEGLDTFQVTAAKSVLGDV